MGFFKKPEVVILKEDSSADETLAEMKEMCLEAHGELKKELENQVYILERGLKGEEEILFQLKYAGMDMFVLRDVYFKVGDLSAQIDFLIVTPKINFIIECKNLYGDITIDNKGNFVRCYQVNGRKIREGIESPVSQNQRHMQVMKDLVMCGKGKMAQYIINKSFESWNKSLIVLANNKTLFKLAKSFKTSFFSDYFLYNYTCYQVDIKHARKEFKLNQQTGESCTCSAQKKNSIFTWKK